jgi:predicted RNase H-like HicB family nuclease
MAGYAVQLVTRYDGMVVATFPDWPGISALGQDDEDALDQARRALAAALADHEARGLAPPEPRARGTRTVEIEATIPLPAA